MNNGLVYVDSYEKCLLACDKTATCVATSFVIGTGTGPRPCYMKFAAGNALVNVETNGARKISGCTRLNIKRKRVVKLPPKQQLGKRAGPFGPDFTFTQDRLTATQTSTVTVLAPVSVLPIAFVLDAI